MDSIPELVSYCNVTGQVYTPAPEHIVHRQSACPYCDAYRRTYNGTTERPAVPQWHPVVSRDLLAVILARAEEVRG